jgi:type IV pilus assembly protein PilC
MVLRAIERVVAVVFVTLFVVALCGLVVLATLLTRGMALPIVFMFAVPLVVVTVRRVQRARFAMILAYLEQAVRLNLPLPSMLDAAAMSEGAELRRQLRGLADWLVTGLPMAEALARSVTGAPRQAIASIAAAERLGDLPATLRRLLEQHRADLAKERPDAVFSIAYPVAVMGFMTLVIVGVSIFIVPKFIRIFDDFGAQLPAMTRTVTDFSRWMGGPLLGRQGNQDQIVPGVLLVFGLPMLIYFGVILLRRTGRGRHAIDSLICATPFVGRAVLDRQVAEVCAIMAQSLDHGVPLPRSVVESSRAAVNSVLRGRLRRWAQRIRGGEPVQASARWAGMPDLLVGVLSAGEAAADVPGCLRFLSRYYRCRFSRCLLIVQNGFLPVIILVLALIIGWVVVGLFLPLVALIHANVEMAL